MWELVELSRTQENQDMHETAVRDFQWALFVVISGPPLSEITSDLSGSPRIFSIRE
jgi:hypothetical protein